MAFKVLANTENMPYDEWLELRKKGIGGSDASIVCGINRYKSPVELWLDKTGQIPYQEAGEAAYWGTQLESIVRNEFSKRTGIFVAETHELLQSEEHPFMLANLDGVCEVPDLGTCVFEAKTASAFKAGEWEDSIPDSYQLQVQHYMAVTGYIREQLLDFTQRYMACAGTSFLRTFATAAELNEWFDAQAVEDRHFCRLYDRVRLVHILGCRYMWLKPKERWTDNPEKNFPSSSLFSREEPWH